MQVIQAPHPFDDAPRPWVFLAGSIEGGTAEHWQEVVTRQLRDSGFDGTVLNPRRDDWDDSWEETTENNEFCEQVEWELAAQEAADQILMYFSPGTISPVTLLELGLSAEKGKLTVCCPKGFHKKGNVDLVCRRHGIPQVTTQRELADLTIANRSTK